MTLSSSFYKQFSTYTSRLKMREKSNTYGVSEWRWKGRGENPLPQHVASLFLPVRCEHVRKRNKQKCIISCCCLFVPGSPVAPIVCYPWQKLHQMEYCILRPPLANLRNSCSTPQPISCVFISSWVFGEPLPNSPFSSRNAWSFFCSGLHISAFGYKLVIDRLIYRSCIDERLCINYRYRLHAVVLCPRAILSI